MNALRILLIGGLTSYRALFAWLSPWILVPTFLVAPIFQILLFAFLGRSAGVGSDGFYVVGNALQYGAVPTLFAMGNTIGDERRHQTLGLLLVSPARRIPLFLGRSLPVIVNGMAVSAFALVAGALLLHVRLPAGALGPIALVVLVCAFSCTGLGLASAALGLRVREVAVLSNLIFGVLLLATGANVPLDRLPRWLAAVAPWLPLTHGIAAARLLVAGAAPAAVVRDFTAELTVGVGYLAVGLLLLQIFERESRRRATLETL